MKGKHRMRIVVPVLALLVVLALWLLWGNRALTISQFQVESGEVPAEFSGFRIAQVSDLHNTEFGAGNGELLALLEEAEPDLIAMTGDLADSRRTDLQVCLDFAQQAVEIAPVFYVPGNHEARIEEYPQLKEGLEAAGVQVLENQAVQLEREGASLTVAGVLDPGFYPNPGDVTAAARMERALESLELPGDGFTVLLAHRPELFDLYAAKEVDLVLSGHAHGGQIRLPLVGGLVAPGQGLFPQYDGGLYRKGDTQMVVSRGLGNSIFPLRVCNRPELVVVELRAQE